jgi:hypothetical protein
MWNQQFDFRPKIVPRQPKSYSAHIMRILSNIISLDIVVSSSVYLSRGLYSPTTLSLQPKTNESLYCPHHSQVTHNSPALRT